ncbi:hypothetical protein D3C87_1593660 [compost metagenome]
MPPRPGHQDAIGTDLGQLDRGDIKRHIGRKIGCRIVDFVEQLLLDRAQVDNAARAFGLGDDEAAIGLHLGDREADIGRARHILETGIGEEPARNLRSAFQQMPGKRA